MPRLSIPILRGSLRPFLLPLLLAMLLSACGGVSNLKVPSFAFSAVGSYKSALRYYERGEIMLARSAALRTNASRPDYPQTQKLLRDKIEPARLRLLRHYRRAAEKAEKQGVLYRAKELYLKTASVWVGDDKMLREAARVDLIMRQRRLDQLIVQRRKEDAQLLDTLNRYSIPKGLDPKDPPIVRELTRAEDFVQTRGRNAWRAAKRELHEDHPEVAYVEAESNLRLRPGSRSAPLLMEEVKAALPKGLRIPRDQRKRSKSAPRHATAKQVTQLMEQGKWIEAHEYAMLYRREGGDEADKLLKTINQTLQKQAESAFRSGQLAFQEERLDKAVEQWEQATELQPDNRDYSDSLRRAQELQERFRILQRKGSNGND